MRDGLEVKKADYSARTQKRDKGEDKRKINAPFQDERGQQGRDERLKQQP